MRRALLKRRYMPWRARLLLAALPPLGGCAPVYLHSPSLEKSTAAAADALPAEADALKPFDEQLANLDAFDQQEDLAVARFWTGTRDAHFARIIGIEPLAARQARINSYVDRRWDTLTGGGNPGQLIDTTPLKASKAEAEAFVASWRRRYLAQKGADPKADLKCEAVTARLSPAQAEAAVRLDPAIAPADFSLGNIALACYRIARLEASIDQLANVPGEIGAARKAAAAADAKVKSDLSPRAAELQRQIDAAETFAKSGATLAQLRAFEGNLKALLDKASVGAKFAGWSKASDKIDEFLQAQVCGSDNADEAAKAEAKCGDIKETSTNGKIIATWGFAKALAKVGDANDARRRAVDWLIAAKAIVAAEKADAGLALEQAKATAAEERRRVEHLEREALYLSRVRTRPNTPVSVIVCHDPHCALARYVDAWNEGRIPAQVLEYRPLQIERQYAVKRARVAVQKQHALALAATAALKGYGAGGLRAELIAQALFDATLLARGGL